MEAYFLSAAWLRYAVASRYWLERRSQNEIASELALPWWKVNSELVEIYKQLRNPQRQPRSRIKFNSSGGAMATAEATHVPRILRQKAELDGVPIELLSGKPPRQSKLKAPKRRSAKKSRGSDAAAIQ